MRKSILTTSIAAFSCKSPYVFLLGVFICSFLLILFLCFSFSFWVVCRWKQHDSWIAQLSKKCPVSLEALMELMEREQEEGVEAVWFAWYSRHKVLGTIWCSSERPSELPPWPKGVGFHAGFMLVPINSVRCVFSFVSCFFLLSGLMPPIHLLIMLLVFLVCGACCLFTCSLRTSLYSLLQTGLALSRRKKAGNAFVNHIKQ